MEESMSGLVDTLDMSTDFRGSLVLAIGILLKWDSSVSHYRTGQDIDGKPYLILMWHEDKKSTPLMAKMQEAEAIADQIYAWLKTQDYGRQPDHDGSNNKGWRITNNGPKIKDGPHYPEYDSSFYDVLCVRPHWIEYHK